MNDYRYIVYDPKTQETIVEGWLDQLNGCFGLNDDPTEEDFAVMCKEMGYWFYKTLEVL